MFLETVTFMDNDALIPINRIKYVNTGFGKDLHKITITSDADIQHEEYFRTIEELRVRYDKIKEILMAQ